MRAPSVRVCCKVRGCGFRHRRMPIRPGEQRMVVQSFPLKPPRSRNPAAGLRADEFAAVEAALDTHRGRPGALLPILHAIQDALGWIPPDAVAVIANDLNQTRAEVHGVVTFYHHFRATRPGRHVVRLCRAEACQALGARELETHAKRMLGIDFHQTTADGAITLEPVYCLGNCGCGPSLLLDDEELHARVTTDAFDAIVRAAREVAS